jgi:type VI secretion system secreted protein Hcp
MKRSIFLLATILISLLPARAAVDMFLKLTDIPGESTNFDHKDEIDVFSYAFGMSNATTVTGGGTGVAKPAFKDISLTKRVDKSSPLLMLNCAKGQHIPEAVLTLTRSGSDKPSNFMVITLTDVLVSSIASSGAEGGDVPVESISLNYGKIKVDYYQQKPDGSVILAGTFAYDIAANKSL